MFLRIVDIVERVQIFLIDKIHFNLVVLPNLITKNRLLRDHKKEVNKKAGPATCFSSCQCVKQPWTADLTFTRKSSRSPKNFVDLNLKLVISFNKTVNHINIQSVT